MIAALSFDGVGLPARGGFDSTSAGFPGGTVVYSIPNWLVSRRGAKDRQRSGGQQPSEKDPAGRGIGIAIGALLDGIPESVVIGLSLIGGGAVIMVGVIATFISNIPEGSVQFCRYEKASRSPGYIFGFKGSHYRISGAASLAGYAAFRESSGDFIAVVTALAADAILAMLADMTISEAVDDARNGGGPHLCSRVPAGVHPYKTRRLFLRPLSVDSSALDDRESPGLLRGASWP